MHLFPSTSARALVSARDYISRLHLTDIFYSQVARYLLEAGLVGMEAVVFLDEEDRKVVLLRDGMVTVPLKSCRIDRAKRFTFFDQVRAPLPPPSID